MSEFEASIKKFDPSIKILNIDLNTNKNAVIWETFKKKLLENEIEYTEYPSKNKNVKPIIKIEEDSIGEAKFEIVKSLIEDTELWAIGSRRKNTGGKRKSRRNRKSKKGKKSRKARKSRRKTNRRRGRR